MADIFRLLVNTRGVFHSDILQPMIEGLKTGKLAMKSTLQIKLGDIARINFSHFVVNTKRGYPFGLKNSSSLYRINKAKQSNLILFHPLCIYHTSPTTTSSARHVPAIQPPHNSSQHNLENTTRSKLQPLPTRSIIPRNRINHVPDPLLRQPIVQLPQRLARTSIIANLEKLHANLDRKSVV